MTPGKMTPLALRVAEETLAKVARVALLAGVHQSRAARTALEMGLVDEAKLINRLTESPRQQLECARTALARADARRAALVARIAALTVETKT